MSSTSGMPDLRWLLRVYPVAYQKAYGDEVMSVVEYRWTDSGGSVRSTMSAVWDLASNAPGVWRDHIGRTTMGMGRGWGLDARFVARSLWKSRGYVATAVLVLACAVAANASVFSYVKGVLDALLTGTTDYENLRPDVWAQRHPHDVRIYRKEERRDKADRKQRRRAKRRAARS